MRFPILFRSTHNEIVEALKDYSDRVSRAEQDRYDAMLLSYEELKKQTDDLLKAILAERKEVHVAEPVTVPEEPRRLTRAEISKRATEYATQRFKESMRGTT
jgi:FixJ family two-component response regulator